MFVQNLCVHNIKYACFGVFLTKSRFKRIVDPFSVGIFSSVMGIKGWYGYLCIKYRGGVWGNVFCESVSQFSNTYQSRVSSLLLFLLL